MAETGAGATHHAGEPSLLKLAHAKNPDVLLRLLDTAELDEDLILVMLRNAALPPKAIERICLERMFTGSYQVQAAIVRHPKTPEAYGLRYLPHLFWRDQLRVARDFRLRIMLRRKAERAIVERLTKLALGEKIELARLATTEILNALVCERDPKLLRACLQSSRATEETVVRLVRSHNVEPAFLRALARDSRWFGRYGVRLALARSEASPVPLVLSILPSLRLEDLRDLADDDRQPTVVVQHLREVIAIKMDEAASEQ